MSTKLFFIFAFSIALLFVISCGEKQPSTSERESSDTVQPTQDSVASCSYSSDCNGVDELCFDGYCRKAEWIKSQYPAPPCEKPCEGCKEGKTILKSVGYNEMVVDICVDCNPKSSLFTCKEGYTCEQLKCVAEGGTGIQQQVQEQPTQQEQTLTAEEDCKNYVGKIDPVTFEEVKYRIIPQHFPSDAPHAPEGFKVGTAQCNKQRQREGFQYVVVWYGKLDLYSSIQGDNIALYKRQREVADEYISQAQAAGWEITDLPGGTAAQFSATKGNKDLYVSITMGFIDKDDKNKVFPEANTNFHVDVKVWE